MKVHLDIDELLGRKLTGTLTAEDQDALDRWIASSPENKKQYERLEAIVHSRLSVPTYIHAQERRKKIWQEGTGTTASRRKQPRTRVLDYYALKVAATVAVLLAAVAVVYFFISHQTTSTSIDQIGTPLLVHKSNALGQRSRIILPDRTVVWLNSGSDLYYPEDFNPGVRTVILRGEAFFDVAKDTSSPFCVRAGDLNVTALGTQFNISSFDSDPETNVALIEGKVKIENDALGGESILLSPGDGINYAKKERSIRTYRFDQTAAATITGWKDGELIFDGSDFEEFLSAIRRWYGVGIRVEGTPNEEWDLHGVYSNEYLINVLESVSYKKNFAYELNEKSLTIKF